jgi:branched-chain amino acid transport system substrate-binding protein
MTARRAVIAIGLTGSLLLTACSGDPAPPPSASASAAASTVSEVKIAFFEDLSADGTSARTAPAFQGAKLAVDAATTSGILPLSVSLVPFDTGGDPARLVDATRTVTDDPAFVAALGAPFLTGQVAIGGALDAAGVPMITLSTLGPDLAGYDWSTWRRAVATQAQEGSALGSYLDGLHIAADGVCLLGDGSPESVGLLGAVTRALTVGVALRAKVRPGGTASASVASSVDEAACGVVVWGGSSSDAALLRHSLLEVGVRATLAGGDAMKDSTYLSVAGPSGRGSIAVCACVDLSTSTDLAAQRFVQDYQSQFGLSPGPFAVEAWDVTRMLLRIVADGATTRGEMATALAAAPAFEGLANRYAFAADGELVPSSAVVRLYRDEGIRWIPIPQPPPA